MEKYVNFIKKQIKIGRLQMLDIDDIGNNLPNNKESEKKAVYLNFQKHYLENFWNFVEFLLDNIARDNEKNFKYYMPLLRVLLEIYSELLYLSNQDTTKRTGICISYYLFSISRKIRINERHSGELKKIYADYISQEKKLIEEMQMDIPINPNDFSYNKLKLSGFCFPNKEKILKAVYFEKCSIETRKIFPGLKSNDFYSGDYRNLSDFVHGNIFSLMKLENFNKEKFWLIAKIFMYSFLIIELVNKEIINNLRIEEFKELADNHFKINSSFLADWKNA